MLKTPKAGIRKAVFFLAVTGTIALCAPNQDSIPLSARNVHPLTVGDSVPSGILSTIEGKTVEFKKLITQKPSVVIFYRGGWCPYCNLQMGQLVTIGPELKKMGYQVLAISPDKPQKLQESLGKHKINYTLLSDRSMEITRKFGLAYQVSPQILEAMNKHNVDLDSNTGNNLHMLPVPAAYVVDQKGLIHFVYFNADIKVRVNPDSLVNAAKKAKP